MPTLVHTPLLVAQLLPFQVHVVWRLELCLLEIKIHLRLWPFPSHDAIAGCGRRTEILISGDEARIVTILCPLRSFTLHEACLVVPDSLDVGCFGTPVPHTSVAR